MTIDLTLLTMLLKVLYTCIRYIIVKKIMLFQKITKDIIFLMLLMTQITVFLGYELGKNNYKIIIVVIFQHFNMFSSRI